MILPSGAKPLSPAVVKVNPSLYSICFLGVAHTGQRCDPCASVSLNPFWECILVSDPDHDVATRLKTLESAVLAVTLPLSKAQGPISSILNVN